MEDNEINLRIIENKDLEESTLPQINQKEADINFAKSVWSKNISKRTKLPLLNRGFPLFVSLLIITALITGLKTDLIPSHLAGAMILLPSFLAALTKPAELKYFKEERCGDWWKAMLSEKRFNELRKDLDMLANMDKDDPPMMFTNGTPDKGVHSQRFVDALVKRAKEVDATLTISNDRKQLTDFMLTKLMAKQNKDSKLSGKQRRKEFPDHYSPKIDL